jgi:hypothetical protein
MQRNKSKRWEKVFLTFIGLVVVASLGYWAFLMYRGSRGTGPWSGFVDHAFMIAPRDESRRGHFQTLEDCREAVKKIADPGDRCFCGLDCRAKKSSTGHWEFSLTCAQIVQVCSID